MQDDVATELKKTGEQLKSDLWDPADLQTLALIAADLVGLNAKMQAAANDGDRQKYREAAARLFDHVKLLALSKMNVADRDAMAALRSFLGKVLAEWVPKLLPLLLAAL